MMLPEGKDDLILLPVSVIETQRVGEATDFVINCRTSKRSQPNWICLLGF